jgi:hypothetical protein
MHQKVDNEAPNRARLARSPGSSKSGPASFGTGGRLRSESPVVGMRNELSVH